MHDDTDHAAARNANRGDGPRTAFSNPAWGDLWDAIAAATFFLDRAVHLGPGERLEAWAAVAAAARLRDLADADLRRGPHRSREAERAELARVLGDCAAAGVALAAHP